MTYTEAQLDAIIDVQDLDPSLTALNEDAVAEELRKRGHPLFPPLEPAKPESPLEARRRKRAAMRAAVDREAQTLDEARARAEAETAARRTLEQSTRQLSEGRGQVQPAAPVASEERRRQVAAGFITGDEPARQLPVAQPPAGQHAVAAHRPEGGLTIPGMEYVTRDMLTVPSLKLKQAQTKDKHGTGIDQVPDGAWFLTHSPVEAADRAKERRAAGEPIDREVVILEIRPGRSYMLPYDEDDRYQRLADLELQDHVDAETSVVCSSLDRVQPTTFEDREWRPFADWCSECPHSGWRRTPSGNQTMDCGEVFRVLLLDVTDGLMAPARLFVSSSAIKPFRNAQTMLALLCESRRLPTWALRFRLGSKPVEWKKGKGFAPVWSAPKLIEDPALVETYGAIRAGLVDQVGAPHPDEQVAA